MEACLGCLDDRTGYRLLFLYNSSQGTKAFLKKSEIIDRLNRVITESIIGSALIRVLHSLRQEENKFAGANRASRDLGLQIVQIFATLIPMITFIASLASVIILSYGGHMILNDSLSLGDFAAFNTYVAILIFPILILGFMSNVIAQAQASYGRIAQVLIAPEPAKAGNLTTNLTGLISVENLSVSYDQKMALKNVSFTIKPGSKNAILGPTAAGKTQLLYALTGLIQPSTGTIKFDDHPLSDYQPKSLHQQLGFVFQDSVMFNMSIKENIAFNPNVTDKSLKKAIATAELTDLIKSLPKGIDTVISERGTSLSGAKSNGLCSLALWPLTHPSYSSMILLPASMRPPNKRF